MTPELKAAILALKEAGNSLFYYSAQQDPAPGEHRNRVEVCLECHTVLIPSHLRDEVEQ